VVSLRASRHQDSAVELVKHIMDREVDQFSEKGAPTFLSVCSIDQHNAVRVVVVVSP
jgi:hypothetical protein